MKIPSARIAPWTVVAVVTVLLAGIGIFVGQRIESAIDTATWMARPHEVQTALERAKGTLDALQDSVQDYLIDGAEGMRYQYEDAVRSLASQGAELSALGGSSLAAADLAEIDQRIADVLKTSRAVIEARNSARPEPLRRLAEVATVAINGARRHLDALISAQQQLLHERERTLRRDVAQMYGGLVATAAIVVCVLAGALMLAEANRELTWFSKRALQIQEQERRSLALELHDQIGQELASLVLSLGRCEREMATTGQSDARSAVQDSIEIARAAYGDVHDLALDLRPAMLDRLGLIPTLQWFARQQARYSGCEFVVEADAFPVALPPDILIAAFRIVQEAVSNAVRHAAARRIDIQAHYHRARIELHVRDDGAGFDPEQPGGQQEPRVGLGLIGMRQRAQDAGGHVSIRSAPGSGTEVIALLALPETD